MLAKLLSKFKRYNSILFEITQRCNLNCMYCYNVWKDGSGYPAGELSTEDAKKVLSKVIAESRCRVVTLTGGEPLLREDIYEIIAFLKNKGMMVNLITNGVLLSEEVAKKCVKAGISVFEVPLLSTQKSIHNGLTRSESFDKSLDAIANVKAAGGKIVSVFVATKLNIKDIGDVIELNSGMLVDGIMFNRFNPGGEGKKYIDDLLPDKEELEAALTVADESAKKYKVQIACSIPIQPCIIDTSKYKHLKFSICPVGTNNAYFTIDPLGNLRICNHSSTILGNLLESSFKDLIGGKIVKSFISAVPVSCLGCRVIKTCQGGCKASAEVCFGSIIEKEPFLAGNPGEKYA